MNRYTLEQRIAVEISSSKSGNEKLKSILTEVDSYSAALLQQTPCSTLRDLLVQEFNRAKAAHPSDSSKPGWRKSVEYLGCMETVLSLMDDMKPVA